MLILTPLSKSDADFILSVYEECKSTMLKAAREVLPESDVEDAMQEAIVQLISKIDTLRQLSLPKLHSYTYNSVRNTALNVLRKRKKMIPLVWDNVMEDDNSDIDARLIKTENIEELYEIIDRLPDLERNLLTLKYKQGLSDWEISAIIGGIQPQSVRSLISRARAHVKEIALREGLLRE